MVWMESSHPSMATGSPRQMEASGEPLVVSDHGRPTVEVRPYRPSVHAVAESFELLRGSVLRFDEPFAPVGEDDWEAPACPAIDQEIECAAQPDGAPGPLVSAQAAVER